MSLLHLLACLGERGRRHDHLGLAERVQLPDQVSGGRRIIQIDHGDRQIRRQTAMHQRDKKDQAYDRSDQHTEKVYRRRDHTAHLPLGYQLNLMQTLLTGHNISLPFFFNITDIPGRKSATFSNGRARTSKVFASYSPMVFVAFHAAYDPISFI